MLDRGKITVGECFDGHFSGIGIDAAYVIAEVFQLPTGFRQVVSFQAAFELLAPDLDQGVACTAGGVSIKTLASLLK